MLKFVVTGDIYLGKKDKEIFEKGSLRKKQERLKYFKEGLEHYIEKNFDININLILISDKNEGED